MPTKKKKFDYDIYSAIPALMASESPVGTQHPSASAAISDLLQTLTPKPNREAPAFDFGIESALPELMATQTPVKPTKAYQPPVGDFLKTVLPQTAITQAVPKQLPTLALQSLIDVDKLQKLFRDPRATPAFYKLALGILNKVLHDYVSQQTALATEKVKGTGRLLDVYKTLAERENNLLNLMAQPTFQALPEVTRNQIAYELASTKGMRQALLNQLLQGIPATQSQPSYGVNPENVRRILEMLSR